MLEGRVKFLIGLGRNVEIERAILCLGWKYILPRLRGDFHAQRLAPIQITSPNRAHPTTRSIDDGEALGNWAPDTFDIVVIHVPPSENASSIYKHLIRVARQGFILLSTTRS